MSTLVFTLKFFILQLWFIPFHKLYNYFLCFFAKLETFKLKILPSEVLSAHCSSKKQMFCIFGFVISHMMRLMLQLAWWLIEEEMELGSCVQILAETNSVYFTILVFVNRPFSPLPWLEVAVKTGLYSLDWQPIWEGWGGNYSEFKTEWNPFPHSQQYLKIWVSRDWGLQSHFANWIQFTQ